VSGMAARKKQTADEELAGLKANPDAAGVALALRSAHARVVAAAAEQVKSRALDGHTQALQQAYERFLADPIKRDPGCRAKLAVLEALDYTESMDEVPFVAATSLTQLEPAWGPPIDTATGCRARGVLALARIGHDDAVPLAGVLLADPEHVVRAAAADALAHTGLRAAAGVLFHKLGVGDEEPAVLLACMSGVLALAPELAMKRFVEQLKSDDAQLKELAALALGQSTRVEAAQALIDAAGECVLSSERSVLLRALGLHRSDRALEALIQVLEGDNETDARAVLQALAARRFEANVRERVKQAVRGRAALDQDFAEAFKEE
jgi:hypothetical protein